MRPSGHPASLKRRLVRHPRAAFLGPQQPALRLIEILPRSLQKPCGSCKPLSNPDQPLLDRTGIPSEPARTFRLLQTPAEPQPVCARPVWIHPLEPAITGLARANPHLNPYRPSLRPLQICQGNTFFDLQRPLLDYCRFHQYISGPAVVLARLL